MKILAFIHSYAPDGEFDSYMSQVIAGFENIGAQLFVINSNKLIKLKVQRILHNYKRIDRFTKKIIEKIQPDLILSTNRGGISKSILDNFKSVPIITLMADQTFLKSAKFGEKTYFQENDHLITPTIASVKVLEKNFPILKGRVHYRPFCTNKYDFNHETKKDINISFVGNILGNIWKSRHKILKRSKNDMELRNEIFSFIDDVNKNYHLDIDYYLQKYKLTKKLDEMRQDADQLLNLAAGIITTNNRIKALDAISDLGLKIYGPKRWFKTMNYSYRLGSCYQYVDYIITRQELCSIYDRTRIGINSNHHQTTSGLDYRVFDLLASSALLITNFYEDSDLNRLFGEDHKIPTYRTPEELRQKVIYYLDHEDERKELVAYCNHLVAKGFSFEERATQIIQIAYPDFVPSAIKQHKTTYIPIPKCYTWGN